MASASPAASDDDDFVPIGGASDDFIECMRDLAKCASTTVAALTEDAQREASRSSLSTELLTLAHGGIDMRIDICMDMYMV